MLITKAGRCSHALNMEESRRSWHSTPYLRSNLKFTPADTGGAVPPRTSHLTPQMLWAHCPAHPQHTPGNMPPPLARLVVSKWQVVGDSPPLSSLSTRDCQGHSVQQASFPAGSRGHWSKIKVRPLPAGNTEGCHSNCPLHLTSLSKTFVAARCGWTRQCQLLRLGPRLRPSMQICVSSD